MGTFSIRCTCPIEFRVLETSLANTSRITLLGILCTYTFTRPFLTHVNSETIQSYEFIRFDFHRTSMNISSLLRNTEKNVFSFIYYIICTYVHHYLFCIRFNNKNEHFYIRVKFCVVRQTLHQYYFYQHRNNTI